MKKTLIVLFLLALILRIFFLSNNSISFHYDMARDAFAAQEILHGDWKILGPPSSTEGLFHGVLYYYLLAGGYGITGGNPMGVAIIFSILNSLAIAPIYFLSRGLFKKHVHGVIACLLYIIGFEAIQYAGWLSNPGLALPCTAFYFYGLYLWKSEKKLGFSLALISAVVATQFQLFLGTLLFNLFLFWLVFRQKINISQILSGVIIACIGMSSYVFAILKFHQIPGIISAISQRTSVSQFIFRTQFLDLASDYMNRFIDIFINNFLPANIMLGGLLGIVALFASIHLPFIVFGLLSSFPIFALGGHNSSYANIGLVVPAILSVVYLLELIWRKNRLAAALIVSTIVFSNGYIYVKHLFRGQLEMVIPKDMVLKNELALIDKTYEIAAGRQFSINTLTLPLWTNTTWAYLYRWYGQEKYGYIPSFYGRDQRGMPGIALVQSVPLDPSFYIIEPSDGISPGTLISEVSDEDFRTRKINNYDFGTLKLQERRILQ